MGSISSKDTRRISFNNNNSFTVAPALAAQKSIDDVNVLDLNTITSVAEKNDELAFSDDNSDIVLPIEKENQEINYWAKRIEFLKREHRIINEIIEKEYEKTLQNTAKLLDSPETCPEKFNKIKPCFEWRSKIMRCYEENPKQPLMCSPLVKAFSDCVTAFHIEE